jgi:hypothetical protein
MFFHFTINLQSILFKNAVCSRCRFEWRTFHTGERRKFENIENIHAKLTKKSHKGSGSDIQCSEKFR